MAAVSDNRLPGIIIPSDPDTHDSSQVTTLMLAAYHGNIETVLTLLKDNQQCIMSRNIFGQTALHYAIDNGQTNVIDTLVAFEAELNEIDSNGQNILHLCAHCGFLSKVETCLTIGINIDICNRNGDTALIIAAQRGYLSIVKLLVNCGSDISIRNNVGLNASDAAFLNDQEEVQSFLLNSQLVPIDHSVEHMMMYACSIGYVELVRTLVAAYGEAIVNIRHVCFDYFSPLHISCRNGYLAVAQLLKQNKANINSRNHCLDTPLISTSKTKRTDIVEWLITQGARMNNSNCTYTSALHAAVEKGYMPTVKLLAKNGTFLNFHKTNGLTAVHFAVQKQHLDILDYLLNKGALPDVAAEYGVTPLIQAVKTKNIALVECLIKYGACVNMHDHCINTPLMVAVTDNSLDMVKYLITKGASVNITNNNGVSPKDAAYSLGYNNIASYLTNLIHSYIHTNVTFDKNVPSAQDQLFQMCKTGEGTRNQLDSLIKAGANVNEINIDGRTPLIVATQTCSKLLVRWLLEKNACVFAKDKQTFTAIQYAVINEDTDLVNLLLKNASHESINYKQMQNVLESAINHCIKVNASASVCITNILLDHCVFGGNCTSMLLKKCIIFGNVAIAQLLFNHQLHFDSFDPTIVTISCMNPDQGMLQCFVKYISDSKYRYFYVKLAVRFCLANQLHHTLFTVIDELFNNEYIFLINNQNFWCGSDSQTFKITMEFVVAEGLDIDAQNSDGWTFLMYAASMGMIEEVEYILLKGADICMVNKGGKNALDIALDAGHYEVAMLLTDGHLVMSGILIAYINIMHKIKL